MVRSLFRYRRYIAVNALGEIRARYAGTSLGLLWNVLHPLTLVVVLSLVFSTIIPAPLVGVRSNEVGFVLYFLSGLVPWLVFTECLSRGTTALIENAVYLRKLPVPEEVFVARTALVSSITFVIYFGVLVAVALASGHFPSLAWMSLLGVMALLVLTAYGLALALAMVNPFLRDVGQAVPVVLQMMMWLAPILYPENSAPESLRTLFAFNPFYPFLNAFRVAFLNGELPEPILWLQMLSWAAVSLSFGWLCVQRLRPELRDVL